MKLAIQGTCLCEAVQLGVARMPRQVTQCNCSVCRRYGTLWAYYPRSAVSIVAPRGQLEKYTPRLRLKFVRCRTCGCVICWDAPGKDPEQRMGVNTRMLDHARMANVPIKVLDADQTWRFVDRYTKPEIWISPSPERVASKSRRTSRARGKGVGRSTGVEGE